MRIRRTKAAFTGAAIASSPPVRHTRKKLGASRAVVVDVSFSLLSAFKVKSKKKVEDDRGVRKQSGRRRRRIQSPLMVSVGDVWRARAGAGAHECALAEKEGGRLKRKGRERGWCFLPERTDCSDASRSSRSSSGRRVQPPLQHLMVGNEAQQLARGGELLILLSARRPLCR